MYQHRAAQLGAQIYLLVHGVDGARTHCGVKRGNGQTGGLYQQPMQAGYRDAGILRRTPDGGALGTGEPVRLVTQRMRRHLKPLVAQRRRHLALARKFERCQHFVAKRKPHRQPPACAIGSPLLPACFPRLPVDAESSV